MLFFVQANHSFADANFFSFSINPSTRSVNFSVSYSGPESTPVTLSVSGEDGYYKDESFTILPNKPVQKSYSNLTPDTDYAVVIYSTDSANSNNQQYSNNQHFRTLKEATSTPPIIPAGTNNTNSTPAGTDNTNNTPAGTDNTGGVKVTTGIKNPIDGINDIPSLIEAILNFVLIVGIPIITLAIIYCGFLFVTAQGNSEKLGKAKKALLYTLIGSALLLGSYVIANAIKGTVDEIKTQDQANQKK